jgi:hypothetical protein
MKETNTGEIHQLIFDVMKQIKEGYSGYPQYQVIMQSLSKVATELNNIRIIDITEKNQINDGKIRAV